MANLDLIQAFEEKKFDIRLIEYHFQTGQLKKEDYEKYLKNLPDLADRIVKIGIQDNVHNTIEAQHWQSLN